MKIFSHDVLGILVGQYRGMFYTYDGLVGSPVPCFLQGSLIVLIGLFRRYGLLDNVAKSKAMMCQPGVIQSGMSKEAVGRWSTGRGETYKERLRRRILCPACGVDLIAGSMTAHWS